MKVIDLLNKIANGEEVPEKIRIYNKNDSIYIWKPIEKLNIPCNFICSTNGMAKEDLEHLDFNFKEIENKINELIEEIEKLKENK